MADNYKYKSNTHLMNSHAITQNEEILGHASAEEMDTILNLQRRVLERVVQATTPEDIFFDICQFIEQTVPECVASIMLYDVDRNHLDVACAPSIPEEGARLLNGLTPGVGAGSCGTSVFIGTPVYVIDTEQDNRWDQLRYLANQFNIRACWSYPIRQGGDTVAGSIAISSFQPRRPSPFHAQLLETAASMVGIVLQRLEIQEQARKSEDLLQNITQTLPGVVYQYQLNRDQQWQFNFLSPGIEAISGLSVDAALEDFGRFWTQVHPEDLPGLWASIVHGSEHRTPWSFEFRLYHKNGDLRWIRAASLLDPHTQKGRQIWNGMLLDITPEKSSIEQLRLAGVAFANTNEGIMIADSNNRIININHAYCDITGYDRDELIGRSPSMLKSDRHGEEFFQALWQAVDQNDHWQGEIWNRRKNGEVVPHWININAVKDPITGQLTHYISVLTDISNIKDSEAKLSHLTHYDALTNLPNRLLFGARLEHALSHRDNDEKIVMLHLDLDRFKHINESLGHRYGDLLLQKVTERLSDTLNTRDSLARIGGDEFAILVEELEHAADAAAIADRIIKAMEQPFEIEGQDYFATASIGIALAPDHGDDLDTLTKHADIALNQAKDLGRNNYAFFQPELSETVEEWIRLEPLLRRALSDNQLVLYYQPQLDSSGKQIIGAEALIRWHHPEMGLISPMQFLPIAEEIGLMSKIGDWVLQEAVQQLSQWRQMGLRDFKLAINLASDQITKRDLASQINTLLTEHQLPPDMLELEILETFLLEHEQEAITTFSALRDLGVQLALDDFGTGYSSLSYLKKLPLNKIKIDRSLVRDIPEDPNDEAITRAVILLGHTLDLKVCAEGVETEEQKAFLELEGCDQLQGFLFSKPVTAAEFNALLNSSHRLLPDN